MPFHKKQLIPISRFNIPPEYQDHLTLYSVLFSKFSIISIFLACILKTEKLSFVKKSSILKKTKTNNKTKIKQKTTKKITGKKPNKTKHKPPQTNREKKPPKHKKTPTLEDPFDPTVGDNPVMEGITLE